MMGELSSVIVLAKVKKGRLCFDPGLPTGNKMRERFSPLAL
jgi:hypothetical protein